MTDSNDTPYYLSDATVQEARGAPTGRMSTFDGALDMAMWVFDTARLDALCSAVARVAEARGYERGGLKTHEAFVVYRERDALRETVRDMKQVDACRLTKLAFLAATIERLTQDNETMAALRAEVAALRKLAHHAVDWIDDSHHHDGCTMREGKDCDCGKRQLTDEIGALLAAARTPAPKETTNE